MHGTICKPGQFTGLNKICSSLLCITFCLCCELDRLAHEYPPWSQTWLCSYLLSAICPTTTVSFTSTRCQLHTYTQQLPRNDFCVTGEEGKCPFAIRVSLSLKSQPVILLISLALKQTSDPEIFSLFLDRWHWSVSVIYLFVLFKIQGCVLTQVHCHWAVHVMNEWILTLSQVYPNAQKLEIKMTNYPKVMSHQSHEWEVPGSCHFPPAPSLDQKNREKILHHFKFLFPRSCKERKWQNIIDIE